MRVWFGIDYIFPEPSNNTVVAGVTVTAETLPHHISAYYSGSVSVGANDTVNQLNSNVVAFFQAKFETEYGITITNGDKVAIYGGAFR